MFELFKVTRSGDSVVSNLSFIFNRFSFSKPISIKKRVRKHENKTYVEFFVTGNYKTNYFSMFNHFELKKGENLKS